MLFILFCQFHLLCFSCIYFGIAYVSHKRLTAAKEHVVDKALSKEYICKVCHKAMLGTGHTQFHGKRYCPNVPGQNPKEEWLVFIKADAESKKEADKGN